jgi:hypothetical protein
MAWTGRTKGSGKKSSPRRPVSRQSFTSYSPVGGGVRAEELQAALLVVLALYASLGLVNLGSEWSTVLQYWHSVVEFVAGSLFQF